MDVARACVRLDQSLIMGNIHEHELIPTAYRVDTATGSTIHGECRNYGWLLLLIII